MKEYLYVNDYNHRLGNLNWIKDGQTGVEAVDEKKA